MADKVDRKRIAQTARRSISSECTLILGAGGGMLAVVLFFFGMPTIIQIAEKMTVNPTGLWIFFSFSISASWAISHRYFAGKKIRNAIRLDTALRKEFAEAKQESVEAKIAAMKENQRNEKGAT